LCNQEGTSEADQRKCDTRRCDTFTKEKSDGQDKNERRGLQDGDRVGDRQPRKRTM
jgi:hypothetical protein